MRESWLSPAARAVRDSLSDKDRAYVISVILDLEEHADVDNRIRFWYPRPPLMLRLYDDDTWQIVYHLPDAATIAILSIARKPA